MIRFLATALLTSSVILLALGCSGDKGIETPFLTATLTNTTPTLAVPSATEQVQEPMWEESQLPQPTSMIITRETTLYEQPPFYRGAMPLWREEEGSLIAGPTGIFTLYQDFGKGWKNHFLYTEPWSESAGVPNGARTTDDSGQLLAEARFGRFIMDKGTIVGIEIEERHYTHGSVQFTCTSEIDLGTGFKTAESDTEGDKERDYYFIWPPFRGASW